MGGGQGLGPLKSILRSLKKIKKEFQVIVVAGSNKKLYNSLKKKIKRYKKKLLVFGYVDNINELMGVSDILITKPGGITTAEALSKKIPMVIIRPIPGQETSNTAYLTAKEAAIKVDKAKEIGPVIDELLGNPEKLRRLAEHSGRIAKPDSSMDIAKLVLELCRRNA